MENLKKIIERAQERFADKLKKVAEGGQGLSKDQYCRYLSMQYHLTKGVQRHFLLSAGHSDLAHRRSLRKFLVSFANEEELHYEIAEKDLENLGSSPGECPLDVTLWWAYFDSIIESRPFVRLGATCILENLSGGAREIIDELFAKATYLTPRNTRFFTIHRHDETLPHGDQILAALDEANLEERHFHDLAEGAKIGTVLYLRMVDWALEGRNWTGSKDPATAAA